MKNCIILDNDKNTMEIIASVIHEFPEINLESTSSNKNNAIDLILETHPDIVFVNIDDFFDNLFEFLFEVNQYCKKQPSFIALSTVKENAYKAFKFDFLDFLLKPLTTLDVKKSILKYNKKFPSKGYKIICLKSYKDYNYLNTEDILFLKADNNATDFYMSNGTTISAFKTLKIFEKTLPEYFVRIHKSYIINSKYISRIHYGKGLCIIKNHSFKIPFTKTFLDNVDSINQSLTEKSLITLN
ncbi:LytR/AlgR family response regulator transcription factor [Aquimarina sp. 2-A2]|uniref:LytR/AlgR family response regulator transcription factor n=1 Tax=Aquimarina sp. 2-A2 TaxID=3382644 RepID=UPI00387F2275